MTTARRAGTVSATTLAGLALALVLTHAAAPGWTCRAGLDVWNLPTALIDAQATRDEAAELLAREERLRQELDLADHLTAELAAGTISLVEAADTIEPVLRSRPGFDTVYPIDHRLPTVRHRAARYLIGRMGGLLEPDPDRLAAVSTRLEAEYAALR